MSGTINPLFLLAAQQDQVVGDSVPRYGGGGPRDLQTRVPESLVYRGDIPTTVNPYGPTVLNMPHDYQMYRELLRPGDPASWDQLLRLMYLNRDNRRT